MNLDLLTGTLLLLMAAALAAVFIFSGRVAYKWPNAPEYVRYGVGMVSLLFLFRGANLLTLSGNSEPVIGRVNAIGALTTLGMTYMVVAICVWFVTSVMPGKAWDVLAWVRASIQRNPSTRPIMIDPMELAHASGLEATAAGEDASAVVREARRWHPPKGAA